MVIYPHNSCRGSAKNVVCRGNKYPVEYYTIKKKKNAMLWNNKQSLAMISHERLHVHCLFKTQGYTNLEALGKLLIYLALFSTSLNEYNINHPIRFLLFVFFQMRIKLDMFIKCLSSRGHGIWCEHSKNFNFRSPLYTRWLNYHVNLQKEIYSKMFKHSNLLIILWNWIRMPKNDSRQQTGDWLLFFSFQFYWGIIDIQHYTNVRCIG